MHINRVTKELRKKVISCVLVGMTLLGAFVGFKHQQNKINDLQYQLDIKQQVEERGTHYTESMINVKTIKSEFNRLNSYRIFEGSINMKHKYNFTEDSILGLKKKGTLSATADIYYQYEVDLSNAEITIQNDIINIKLPRPTLNENSVHRKVDTFHIIEDETTMNWLMRDKEGVKIMRYWEDTFDIKATQQIKDYYNTVDNESYLKSIAKREVRDLLTTLGIDNLNVKVSIE